MATNLANFTISGSLLYVKMRNTPVDTYATASASDLDTLSPYVWRLINGVPCTTQLEQYEVRISMAHILTGKHRSLHIAYRDNNPLNCIRDNLHFPNIKTTNTWEDDTTYAVLHIGNTCRLVMDKEDAEFAKQYNWSRSTVKPYHIYAYTKILGTANYEKKELGEFIMDIQNPFERVRRRDNQNDYRRSNLYIDILPNRHRFYGE